MHSFAVALCHHCIRCLQRLQLLQLLLVSCHVTSCRMTSCHAIAPDLRAVSTVTMVIIALDLRAVSTVTMVIIAPATTTPRATTNRLPSLQRQSGSGGGHVLITTSSVAMERARPVGLIIRFEEMRASELQLTPRLPAIVCCAVPTPVHEVLNDTIGKHTAVEDRFHFILAVAVVVVAAAVVVVVAALGIYHTILVLLFDLLLLLILIVVPDHDRLRLLLLLLLRRLLDLVRAGQACLVIRRLHGRAPPCMTARHSLPCRPLWYH